MRVLLWFSQWQAVAGLMHHVCKDGNHSNIHIINTDINNNLAFHRIKRNGLQIKLYVQ